MTSLTVPGVAGWRPEELAAAADRLLTAAARVDDDAHAVRRHLGDALDDAGGAWASTAASRADQEARWGQALADACTRAAAALRDGAARLGHARQSMLDAVERARAAGLDVMPDGRVPVPVGTAPLDQLGLTPEQRAATQEVAHRCAGHEREIFAALDVVAAVDEDVADTVARVDFPESLTSVGSAHLERARLLGGDQVAALGTAGGAVVVARTARAAAAERARAGAVHRYAGLVRAGASTEDLEQARRALAFGTSGSPVLKVAGRLSMPATIGSGVTDAWDGGGYGGARGWATRGFGAAGAAGAAAVLAGASLAPAAVVVGGAAVVAYGVWSAGNYVVDHWDQVEDAWAGAAEWSTELRVEAAQELGDAVDWAGDRLADAGSGVLDGLGELF